MSVQGRGPLFVTLLTAQTADETQSQPVDLRGYSNFTVFQTGAGTITSGVLTIEEAAYDPHAVGAYGGTWSSITTLDPTQVSGGATQAYHAASDRAYSFVKARISTAIGGGGSLSAILVAN